MLFLLVKPDYWPLGSERVRNVECLNLWNVDQCLSSIPSPGGRAGKAIEPYRKFSSSGAVSSIKFFLHQPELLLAGVKGFGVRIYDLRENTGNACLQFPTSCVYNTATDPSSEHYFACCGTGKDTTIQIWDNRYGSTNATSSVDYGGDPSNQTTPVMEYTEAFAVDKSATPASIWSLRYCSGKSGLLGALASNGQLKVFETSRGYVRTEHDSGTRLASGAIIGERLLTKRVHTVERAYDDTHQSRQESERIVAFDFTNLAGSRGNPSAILLRGNGGVSIHELSGPPTVFSLSAQGALSYSASKSPLLVDGRSISESCVCTRLLEKEATGAGLSSELRAKLTIITTPLDQGHVEDVADPGKALPSSQEAHEHAIGVRSGLKPVSVENALTAITMARKRCIAGYSLDVERNMRIVRDDSWLQTMWGWIGRAQNYAEDGGMIAGGLDMSYLGIFAIWNNDTGSDQIHRGLTTSKSNEDFRDAVIVLANSLEPILSDWNVESQEHRHLCLHTCGLALSPQRVEVTVQELANNGEKTKAAALAVIFNEGQLALQALRTGSVSTVDRELSLALAGYLKGLRNDQNDTWHETIKQLVTNMLDPYARAILAFVSHGDWHDVLQETSLPLRDRVGIALMYLPNDELSEYIHNSTSEAIKAGDIEAIILTGIGPKTVSLFENYIIKFGDLQTAVLAHAYASPRYFTDPRVTIWRQTYRTQLNELGLFIQRAQFDVQHTKLSTLPNGASTLPAPSRQVSLRCAYCDQCLDRNPDHSAIPANTRTNYGMHQGSIFGISGKSGTACPKCGRHMPRCVICMNPVGVPDPHTKGAVAKPMSKKEAMDNFVSFCRRCWHVTHAGHAEEWFRRHSICPARGCDCRCIDVEASRGF